MTCTLLRYAQPVDPTRVYNELGEAIYDLCLRVDGVIAGTTPIGPQPPPTPAPSLFALVLVNPDGTPVHNPDGTFVYVLSPLP